MSDDMPTPLPLPSQPEALGNAGALELRELLAAVRQLREENAKIGEELRALRRLVDASPGLRTVPITPSLAMVRLATGHKFYLDPQDIGIASNLMTTGSWESKYLPILRSEISRGAVCVDAGANFGYYTVYMAHMSGPEGNVYSFEPNPNLLYYINRNIRVNGLLAAGRVNVFGCALGAEAGEATLNFVDHDYGGGSLHISARVSAARQLDAVPVAVKRLDDLVRPTDRKVFCKIDCEGSEPLVIRGGDHFFRQSPDIAMLIEFTPVLMRSQQAPAEFLEHLGALGFSLSFADDPGRTPRQVSEVFARGSAYLFARKRPA
jgi:FkbM family methyltransferase